VAGTGAAMTRVAAWGLAALLLLAAFLAAASGLQ
jgi:hypothetical protein